MVTDELVQFAISAAPTDGAHAMMRLSLFDWAVCGVAGHNEPVSKLVRTMAQSDGGAPQATVFGGDMQLPARAAALVNGTISHALDFDDTHFAHIGHPSVAVVPAALAVAERIDDDGEVFLDACTIGVEASIRVGKWLGRAHYDHGFHQTATAGAFGAVVAAGRLLSLDATQMRHAIGIAATRASGLKSQFGTMGKPYHAGLAASTGVEAALLAQAGFISAPDALEGEQGFGPTHAGAASATAFDELGEHWLFDWVTHKYHACCHGTHAVIEALNSLSRRLQGKEVDTVRVNVHPSWLKVCDIAAPETGLEAKFSLRMTAAMALDGQDTGALDTFSDAICTVPKLVDLRDRVTVVPDDGLSVTAAHVTVQCVDGRKLTAVHDLRTPIPMPDRATKLRGKARALLGDAVFAPMWDAITSTDHPDLGALVHSIAADQSAPRAAAE